MIKCHMDKCGDPKSYITCHLNILPHWWRGLALGLMAWDVDALVTACSQSNCFSDNGYRSFSFKHQSDESEPYQVGSSRWTNFTLWQDNMIFLLIALKVHYILDPNLTPILKSQESDFEERKKWKEGELLFRWHILNTLFDCLCDLYTDTQSAKKIWKALEFKFKVEEECTKKCLISKYFDFKIMFKAHFCTSARVTGSRK